MATSLQRRRAPATPLPRRKRLRAPRPDESLVHHGVPGAESAIHYCLVSDLEAIIQDDENLVGVDAETSMPRRYCFGVPSRCPSTMTLAGKHDKLKQSNRRYQTPPPVW